MLYIGDNNLSNTNYSKNICINDNLNVDVASTIYLIANNDGKILFSSNENMQFNDQNVYSFSFVFVFVFLFLFVYFSQNVFCNSLNLIYHLMRS